MTHPIVIQFEHARDRIRRREAERAEQEIIEAVEAELDNGPGSMDELIARALTRLRGKRRRI